MISQRDFNDSTMRKRNAMAGRLKARYWKTGRRAGQIRIPARELPFTLEEFRAWAMKTIGLGAVKCFYCPCAIDILHFQPDHYMPLELDGSLSLDNLVAACEQCNRLKGAMPPEDFIKLQYFLEHDISVIGCADAMKRLRAGAMGIRLGYHLHSPAENAAKMPRHAAPIAKNRSLDFEDF